MLMDNYESIQKELTEAQNRIGEHHERMKLATDEKQKEIIWNNIKDEVANTKYLSVQLGAAKDLESKLAAQETVAEEPPQADIDRLSEARARMAKEMRETISAAEEYQKELPTQETDNKQRIVVEASVVKNALPSVIVPLTFSIQSALAQLDDIREVLRTHNKLPVEHPDIHKRLLEILNQVSVILTKIYTAIPEDIDTVSTEDAEKVAGYFSSFKNEVMLDLQSYVNSKAMAKAFVPSAFILTCAGVGSFFGPLGFIAGANAGNIVLGKVKPIDVANLVRKNVYSEMSDAASSTD